MCALNGKYSSLNKQRHPESESLLCAVVKHGWAIAQSPILITTIKLERLRKRGYQSMLDHYLQVALHYNEPLYSRPERKVV